MSAKATSMAYAPGYPWINAHNNFWSNVHMMEAVFRHRDVSPNYIFAMSAVASEPGIAPDLVYMIRLAVLRASCR